ncbi:histidine--tRNA ligase [SAR86 cluster bacterium]|nr:histidine--tRNA ligase [SAR86 cluster bacterium]
MSKFQKVRGMHDVPLDESSLWSEVIEKITHTLKSYSYSEIRLPIIENTDLFKRSVGDETDIVHKEMFTFDSKSKKSMTLRPEGTAGCMRASIEQGLLDKGQQRLFYHGPMYRYERPQKGRNREFYQFSAEAYGNDSVSIELELIQIVERITSYFKIPDASLEINSLGSKEAQDKFSLELVKYLTPFTDELDEDSQKRLDTNPIRILDSKIIETQNILANAPKVSDFYSQESAERYNNLKKLLDDFGINYLENHNLVRGLDYYNDIVFEWKSETLGSQSAFCAGGRYDGLSKKLGGRDTPAIGLSFGIDRLILACKDSFNFIKSKKIAIIILDKSFLNFGAKFSERLRDVLPSLEIRFSGLDTNLKSQLKKAVKNNSDFAIIIGREEVESNSFSFKNLSQDKNQEKLSEEEIISKLK